MVMRWSRYNRQNATETLRHVFAGQRAREMSDGEDDRYRSLASELRELAALDVRVRSELAADGSLFDGYNPRMEAVHRQNSARLAAILDEHGWPSESVVGSEAARAAWLIAQHAIGEPPFQRRCLRLLLEAASRGDVPAWQPAMLEDRIRMFEGRPQVYGTQLEADDEGNLRPYWIEDPSRVAELRRQVGLAPLDEVPRRAERVMSADERSAHERGYQEWLRRVGWRP